MAGSIMPDFGGSWVLDTGGQSDCGDCKGSAPPGLMKLLEGHGKNGIVISGVVSWIAAQIDTQTNDAWKSLADRCFQEGEISAGKEALRAAKGTALESLVP